MDTDDTPSPGAQDVSSARHDPPPTSAASAHPGDGPGELTAVASGDDVRPRWLDDDEQRAWRQLAAVILTLPAALDAQLRRDHGMRHVDYWVLALLSEAADHRLALHQLAAQANASLSRLSHVVTRLEQRGLVTRHPSAEDARVTDAVLTDAGVDALERAAPGHVAAVRRLVFDALGPADVAALEQLAGRVAAQLERSAP